MSAGFIHFDDDPMQFAAMPRRFHANRHLREEFLQDDVFVHADHRLVRTGHADVGLIGGAVGKNPRVGGRVRACGCPP